MTSPSQGAHSCGTCDLKNMCLYSTEFVVISVMGENWIGGSICECGIHVFEAG